MMHEKSHARYYQILLYCKSNNYRRIGNVAVPGLFIYSGGKQGGNYLEWRSRKKGVIIEFLVVFSLRKGVRVGWKHEGVAGNRRCQTAGINIHSARVACA